MEYRLCPECGEWSPPQDWKETEVGCEDCGSHGAQQCPKCEQDIDTVKHNFKEVETCSDRHAINTLKHHVNSHLPEADQKILHRVMNSVDVPLGYAFVKVIPGHKFEVTGPYLKRPETDDPAHAKYFLVALVALEYQEE